MDLIYTNAKKVDQGAFLAYSLDLSFGEDQTENDFELTLGNTEPILEDNSVIYIENTEYGGIVDGLKSNTDGETITHIGRTWHGILNSKVIEPDPKQNKKFSGSVISFASTKNEHFDLLKIYGKTTQNGTPSPNAPVPLTGAGDGGSVAVKVGTSEKDTNPQTLTISTPNGLPGIPVTSGGNYTDSAGKQWVCDEVDFASGKYVQRIGKITYDGSETWALSGGYSTENFNAFYIQVYDGASGLKYRDVPVMSDHFCRKNDNMDDCEGVYFGVVNIHLYVYVSKQTYPDVSTFKQYLSEQKQSGNPVTIMYQLEDTVETALSTEELAAHATLHTNYPNTTIFNDGGAEMEIEYVTGGNYCVVSGDANAVLDSLIARLGLSGLFVAAKTMSGVNIAGYQFSRYCMGYDGIRAMLKANGAKLKIRWENRCVVLSAEPIADYSDSPVDGDVAPLTVERHGNKVNHLICLGRGELAEREVIHLYVDQFGRIGDYQAYTGLDEVMEVYDYSNAESPEELRKGGIERLEEVRDNDKIEVSINEGNDITYDICDVIAATDTKTGNTANATVIQKIVKINNGTISIEYKTGR